MSKKSDSSPSDPSNIFQSGNTYHINVKPNSAKNEVQIENDSIVVRLTAQAQDNKANQQLVKFLKKEFKLSAEIIKGHSSRKKVIRIQ